MAEINLMFEFQKRYKGDASQTMAICAEIASEFRLNVDEVADFIYIHRYETEDALAEALPELEECDIEDE